MEVFAQTNHSLDALNTEKGFKTALFGFSRSDVLAFIDQLMNNNANRNSQLNSSLIDMEAKLTELKDENEALLDKTRVLVDQLEEKRGEHIKYNKDVDILKNEISDQLKLIDQLKEKIFSQEQENNLLQSEITALKRQIATLEERLSVAKETSKCADDTIVAAQRAASRIMTEAVKQSPKPEHAVDVSEIVSIRDTIRSLEEQLKSVSHTVEVAIDSQQQPPQSQYENYYKREAEPQEEIGLNGGWISAKIPQPRTTQNVSYWQPVERPTTPIGWQQPENMPANQYQSSDDGFTMMVSEQMLPTPDSQLQDRVYHHRRAEPQLSNTIKIVRPTAVNYSQLRRQRGGKYLVTPHKR